MDISLNGSNKNPNRNNVARVFKTPDSKDKLDIFVFIEMDLSIGYFFEDFGKGGVGHIKGKTIEIFLVGDLVFDSVSLLLDLCHCFIVNGLVTLAIEQRITSTNTVIHSKSLTQR